MSHLGGPSQPRTWPVSAQVSRLILWLPVCPPSTSSQPMLLSILVRQAIPLLSESCCHRITRKNKQVSKNLVCVPLQLLTPPPHSSIWAPASVNWTEGRQPPHVALLDTPSPLRAPGLAAGDPVCQRHPASGGHHLSLWGWSAALVFLPCCSLHLQLLLGQKWGLPSQASLVGFSWKSKDICSL